MENNLLHKASGSLKEWLHYHIFTRKLATPVGIAMLGFLTIFVAYVTVLVDQKLGIGLVAAVAVLLLCGFCVGFPLLGFYVTFVVTLFSNFPERVLNLAQPVPMGIIPEYLAYLVLLGVVTRQQYRKEITSSFWSNTITIWIMVLLGYYILQVINPAMGSRFGWFNYVRKQVSFASFFYISYCVLNSRQAILKFTNFWIVLTTIHALYACKQQWLGYFGFETVWLHADPQRYMLFVNFDFVRKFGLLSDPASAGILYACSTVMLLVFMIRARQFKKQALFFVLTVVHFLAATYTGTRTATMMVVGGIVLYCVLYLYERRTMLLCAGFVLMFTGLLVAPIYDNVIINRLRSAFEGSKDPSAMVRDINRKIAQPYVYSHPIGGGLNTSGMIGELYNPGHYLSNIPPDSGYMQTMMEQGPIGLALMLIFYFVLLKTGIRYFYRVRDPETRTLYAAHMCSVFTLIVAQYSQMAIGQYPSILYYYAVLVIFLKLHQYQPTKPPLTT